MVEIEFALFLLDLLKDSVLVLNPCPARRLMVDGGEVGRGEVGVGEWGAGARCSVGYLLCWSSV